MQRSGVVHVIESVIAAVLLLGFILVILPIAQQDITSSVTADRTLHPVLQAADTAAGLRHAAVTENLDTLDTLIDTHVTGRTTAVGLSGLHTTTAVATVDTTYTASFTGKQNTEQQVLRLWYRNATDPAVTVNGEQVSDATGQVTNTYETVDIAEETNNGANTLEITATDTSRVGYSIDQYTETVSGEPPTGRDVFTASYLIAGANTTFAPREVTVLAW